MAGNKIVIEWKEEEIAKRGIKLKGQFLRNTNIELFWHMKVDIGNKTYFFSFNNDRAIIEAK